MQNSIRDNLTKEDIIADIRLQLDADPYKKITVVVVEGNDDITFFRGKFSGDVEIIESFSGKKGVEEIVNRFDDSRVIGICDKDYDTDVRKERILYYDYSCLEMMMISDDRAFENFCYTYYQGMLSPGQLRMKILEDIKWISVFRRLNAQKSMGVNFKTINYNTAYIIESEKIDLSVILLQLDKGNQGTISGDCLLVSQINEECCCIDGMDCLLQITNGHDFLNCFQRICSYNGKKSTSSGELFKGLVCSFRREDFQKTRLYANLITYQNSKNLSIF